MKTLTNQDLSNNQFNVNQAIAILKKMALSWKDRAHTNSISNSHSFGNNYQ